MPVFVYFHNLKLSIEIKFRIEFNALMLIVSQEHYINYISNMHLPYNTHQLERNLYHISNSLYLEKALTIHQSKRGNNSFLLKSYHKYGILTFMNAMHFIFFTRPVLDNNMTDIHRRTIIILLLQMKQKSPN